MQTQTPLGSVTRLRSPFMPCMRPRQLARAAAAPATSAIGPALCGEAAYRKQVAAARQRRLEAIVAGADPVDAPAEIVRHPRSQTYKRGALTTAEGDARTSAGTITDTGTDTGTATSAGEGSAELAADCAVEIAQRFLSSSVGQYFANVATGVQSACTAHTRPLLEAATAHLPANYQVPPPLRSETEQPAGKSAAHAPVLIGPSSAAYDRSLGVDMGRHGTPSSVSNRFEDGDLLGGADGRAPPPHIGLATNEEIYVVEAVEAAVYRFGLHEPASPGGARLASRSAAMVDVCEEPGCGDVPAASEAGGPSGDARLEAVHSRQTPSSLTIHAAPLPRDPAGQPPPRRSPSAWEVDVAELRRPPPEPKEEPRQPPPPLQLRPRPPRGEGKRSHAGWRVDL